MREHAQSDLRWVGAILFLLFVVAVAGVPGWSVPLAFLIISCLVGGMVIKAPLSWPVRTVLLAILSCLLLFQAGTRVINHIECEGGSVRYDYLPSLGTTLRALNPFEYEGCFNDKGD